MSDIIQNAVYIPVLDRYLISRHRHDYQEARLPNGDLVAVDGGLDYVKRSGDYVDYQEMTLTTSDPDETVYQKLLWGTRGVLGNEPLRYIRVKDMEPLHARRVLAMYGGQLSPWQHRAIFRAAREE